MNEDVVADLKQFIVGVITQQTTDIRQDLGRIDGRLVKVEVRLDSLETGLDGLETRLGGVEVRVGSLESKVDSLEAKIDDGFAAIADALEVMNSRNDAVLKGYGKRFARLEQKTA
jgi:septal ring factor EnvC (AmiA/AmiB activator)